MPKEVSLCLDADWCWNNQVSTKVGPLDAEQLGSSAASLLTQLRYYNSESYYCRKGQLQKAFLILDVDTGNTIGEVCPAALSPPVYKQVSWQTFF